MGGLGWRGGGPLAGLGPGPRTQRSGRSRAAAAGRDPNGTGPRSGSGPGPGGSDFETAGSHAKVGADPAGGSQGRAGAARCQRAATRTRQGRVAAAGRTRMGATRKPWSTSSGCGRALPEDARTRPEPRSGSGPRPGKKGAGRRQRAGTRRKRLGERKGRVREARAAAATPEESEPVGLARSLGNTIRGLTTAGKRAGVLTARGPWGTNDGETDGWRGRGTDGL